MTQTLTIAVCICNGVTLADFVPPLEIIGVINFADMAIFPAEITKDIKYRIAIDYVAPTKEPVLSLNPMQPTINPTRTYSEVLKEGLQYDILWIPSGPMPADLKDIQGSSSIPKEQLEFIQKQAPKAQYIVSVCAGALQLAMVGLLDGKRATTNKCFFKIISEQTSDKIHWVAKARWVVDGNIWSSSGVSAGMDMALAFLEKLTSKAFSEAVRGLMEVPWVKSSEDDPFAAFYNLV